jgi:hypothetical protein
MSRTLRADGRLSAIRCFIHGFIVIRIRHSLPNLGRRCAVVVVQAILAPRIQPVLRIQRIDNAITIHISRMNKFRHLVLVVLDMRDDGPAADELAFAVERGLPSDQHRRTLTRDNDQKFGRAFDDALRSRRIMPVRLPYCAPNLNAHVERFIQTVQNECLDRFMVMGTSHLDHLMAEFIEHYNRERPHSAIDNRPPVGRPPPLRLAGSGEVRCRERLGGVLRHYYRKAA